MKKKNQRKALQLNRETVVRLENEELSKAEGGIGNCTGCVSGCGIFEAV
jgi:hypothetical protein